MQSYCQSGTFVVRTCILTGIGKNRNDCVMLRLQKIKNLFILHSLKLEKITFKNPGLVPKFGVTLFVVSQKSHSNLNFGYTLYFTGWTQDTGMITENIIPEIRRVGETGRLNCTVTGQKDSRVKIFYTLQCHHE